MIRIRVLLALLLLLIPATADTVPIPLKTQELPINSALRYRLDASGSLSPEAVYSEDSLLQPFPSRSIQIPREGILWLLLTLENRSRQSDWVIENSMNLERMELYLYRNGEWVLDQASGNSVPFNDRQLQSRTPAFELTLPPSRETSLLLRVRDYQSSSVQLQLKNKTRFWDDYLNKTLILGLVFGFFGALIVYNLLVYLISRDTIYLIYSLYMTAFFLNQFAQERLLSEYIQPGRAYGFFWFILFGGATIASGVEFFRRFVETEHAMPRTDSWMRGVRAAGILIALSAFLYAGPISADLLNILSLAAMGLILWVLAVQIRRGVLPALICLAGSLIYLAGTAAEIISTLMPVQITPFSLSAQLYGAVAQVLLLGFALGSRNHRLHLKYQLMQEEFRRRLEDTVKSRTSELEEANRRLSVYAVTDSLTGLYNRAALEKRIAELNALYLRRATTDAPPSPITAAYLDLDNFKYYNDNFGHNIGDRLLMQTSRILKENLRGDDLLFRVGGDEFLVLMPDTGIEAAQHAARRMIAAFSEIPQYMADIPGLFNTYPLSVSIGLACSGSSTGRYEMETLIKLADKALLHSKGEGKNRYSVA